MEPKLPGPSFPEPQGPSLPLAGSPGSHSEAVRAGLPVPSCGTLGTWANVSGPQVPLLQAEGTHRPHFTGLLGGSQEVPGRQSHCVTHSPPSLIAGFGALSHHL